MPRKGGKRKKTLTHATPHAAPDSSSRGGVGDGLSDKDIPRSVVVRASKVTPKLRVLIKDMRKVMSPYTALNLKERNVNRLKDYTAVATQLGLTHLLSISQTNANVVFRIAKFMNGPTLHFRVTRYSLANQIKMAQKKPFESSAALQTAPIVVLNNFGQSEENTIKLMRTTLQHMFPSINVKTVRLTECRRVVLFHYRKDDGLVEMRHYAIKATPVGVHRNIKKILQAKIPNLADLQDISEFLDGSVATGAVSDSEAEEDAKVVLPERFRGRGNDKAQQSAIKLVELGPRLTMELFKVEAGMCEGDILYHKFESKSEEDAMKTKQKIDSEKMLKAQRRAQQEANVKRKLEEKAQKKAEKESRKRRRLEGGEESAEAAQAVRGSATERMEEDGEDAEGDDEGSYVDENNEMDEEELSMGSNSDGDDEDGDEGY